MARRLLPALAALSLTSLALGLGAMGVEAQFISVHYDANTLPGDDPIAPWQSFIAGNASQSIDGGVLTLSDNSASDSYVTYLRVEPDFSTQLLVHFEARVGHVSNNGWFGEPAFVIQAYDPTRPPTNAGWIYYPLSFYSDHIELRRHFPDGTSFVIATVQVPDLGSTFHVVQVDWHEGAERHFTLFLDGMLVAVTESEPATFSLNAIGFGHGLYVGSGTSQWDYLRYWTDVPTPTQSMLWGALKGRYRGERRP